MKTSKRLEGIGEYYFSKKLRKIELLNQSGEPVINLGIGSPDLPPHTSIIETLNGQSLRPDVHGYQNYKGNAVLRQAIADWYKKWYAVDLDSNSEILPLIGSKEGIMHVCMTYVNPGDLVLIPNPGYPTYRSAAMLAGGKVVEYTLTEQNNWFPDFKSIAATLQHAKEEAITTGKDVQAQTLMFVNYPHMPTGQLPTEQFFIELVAFAKEHNILLCHDNPYSFILNERPLSLLAVEGSKDVVIELNSLSKSHNMAGWRVGMLSGAKSRIDDVIRFKSNMDSGMLLPLQLAAATALALGDDWYRQLNSMYSRRRKIVFELLDLLRCEYDPGQAGLFVWAKIPSMLSTGFQLSDDVLLNTRVFITPGGIFGSAGDKYIRVSLCSSEEKLRQAIQRIQEFSEAEK
jgi:aspartate/methionine/tyrosine aminotransferase